jgi:hypothetical protein
VELITYELDRDRRKGGNQWRDCTRPSSSHLFNYDRQLVPVAAAAQYVISFFCVHAVDGFYWSELVAVLAMAPRKGVRFFKLQVLFYDSRQDFLLSAPSQLGSNTIPILNCGQPGKPWPVDTDLI